MSLDTPAFAARSSPDHDRLRLHFEGVRERARQAVAWSPDAVGIPDRDRENGLLRVNDVAFYAGAREEVSAFADLCLGLLHLHHPRGGSGQQEGPGRRCSSCAARWPCPTMRELSRLPR